MTLEEWDALPDGERDLWVADDVARSSRCPKCDRPLWECSDQERVRFPQRAVCFESMEREAADRAYAELHEARPFHDGSFMSWSAERTRSHPYHFRDGVTVYVADEDAAPWDEFTTRESVSPLPPGDGGP